MSDDEKLAERLAWAEIGEDRWREASDWFRWYVVKNWLAKIKAIRSAGLELVEREDGR